jgi:hypothetical protein
MGKSIAIACALALAATSGIAQAQSRRAQEAQETGIAEIHQWVKIGRKTCMLDHFHDGSGSGSTRAEAERAAIKAWAEFTAWEYGTPWGRYSIAASRKADCSRSSGGWTCAVQARPCRPY